MSFRRTPPQEQRRSSSPARAWCGPYSRGTRRTLVAVHPGRVRQRGEGAPASRTRAARRAASRPADDARHARGCAGVHRSGRNKGADRVAVDAEGTRIGKDHQGVPGRPDPEPSEPGDVIRARTPVWRAGERPGLVAARDPWPAAGWLGEPSAGAQDAQRVECDHFVRSGAAPVHHLGGDRAAGWFPPAAACLPAAIGQAAPFKLIQRVTRPRSAALPIRDKMTTACRMS